MKHMREDSDGTSVIQCLLRIFDALGFGIVLIGSGKKVLHFNHRIETHLGAGLMIRLGHLSATDSASDQVLQNMLDSHLAGEAQPRQALGLHRKELRPLILRMVSLGEEASDALDGASVIAILVDPEYCPEPAPELLQQAFSLTRKEGAVAIQLMCGDTLQGIAKQTGIGIGTIRAQTKAIFAKTETKRQAELVGLLTRLAVISSNAH